MPGNPPDACSGLNPLPSARRGVREPLVGNPHLTLQRSVKINQCETVSSLTIEALRRPYSATQFRAPTKPIRSVTRMSQPPTHTAPSTLPAPTSQTVPLPAAQEARQGWNAYEVWRERVFTAQGSRYKSGRGNP